MPDEPRQLRARKPINYNIAAAEVQIEAVADQKRRGRKRGSPASDQTGEDDSSASEPKSEPESEKDSSEAELDESEDEGVIPKRRRKDHGLPKRTLPKRNTTARPSLKEPSESENESSGEEERPKRRQGSRTRVPSRRSSGRLTAKEAAKPVQLKKSSRANKASKNMAEPDGSSGDDDDSRDSDSPVELNSSESKDNSTSGSDASGRPAKAKPAQKPQVRKAQPKKKTARESAVDYDKICVVLDIRQGTDCEECYVAYNDRSYRECEWVPIRPLRDMPNKKFIITQFYNREKDPRAVHGVLPEWTQVDRILSHHKDRGEDVYLVKFKDLPYVDASWETAKSLANDKEHIKRFEEREAANHDKAKQALFLAEHENDRKPPDVVPTFENGRSLRDYQLESFKWMVNNMFLKKHCILGDEMGLGKTAQSIAVMEYQRQVMGTRGPFLVVAPLTTLCHWKREIETWTTMNAVVYHGNKDEREDIQQYEFEFSKKRRGNQVKFDVVLTAYDGLLRDKVVFKKFHSEHGVWPTFQILIVDEAHRLKGQQTQLRKVVKEMDYKWLLLLTGTPVQNNLRELFGIMNLLDCEKWPTEEAFFEKYGGAPNPENPNEGYQGRGVLPTVEQIRHLQEDLRPILLRRMKEDVEKLPSKEEVIVWVELTQTQKVYYKALYSRQIGALLGGKSGKNMPQMRNLAMQLRKVCCHPYLCEGLEDDILGRQLGWGLHKTIDKETELRNMIETSGKMVLLHKLLPKLKSEGRKVLIFSQFKIMLNVIEDSLGLAGYPCERIDGDVKAPERQAAIDRFMNGGDESFVFLLSTRAGGQGITLTAADTAILYDSDWNPQNDLQAMARCHRIGQAKEVTVYRLICKDTYEQSLFNVASRKYGLDEAILGSMNAKDPEQNAAKIAALLQNGAHALVEEAASTKASEDFANADISEILAQRTEKRQIGSRAGNTFSTAQFTAEPKLVTGASAREYWASLMPDDVEEYERKKAAGPTPLGPRKRKKVNYAQSPANQKALAKAKEGDKLSGEDTNGQDDDNEYSGSDSASESSGSEAEEAGQQLPEGAAESSRNVDRPVGEKKSGKRSVSSSVWNKAEVQRLMTVVGTFAPGHFKDLALAANIHRPAEEVEAVGKVLIEILRLAARQVDKQRELLAEIRQHEKEISHLSIFCDNLAMEHYLEQKGQAEAKLRNLKPAAFLSEVTGQIPASIAQVLDNLATYIKNMAPRLYQALNEAQLCSKLVKGLNKNTHVDDFRLLCLKNLKNPVKLLRPWHHSYDLALLVNVYKFGHKRSMSSMDTIFRDPESPFYHAVATDMMQDGDDIEAENDNMSEPLDPNWKSWYAANEKYKFDLAEFKPGSADYKKLLDQLNQRTRVIIQSLFHWEEDENKRRDKEMRERAVMLAKDPNAKIVGGREQRRKNTAMKRKMREEDERIRRKRQEKHRKKQLLEQQRLKLQFAAEHARQAAERAGQPLPASHQNPPDLAGGQALKPDDALQLDDESDQEDQAHKLDTSFFDVGTQDLPETYGEESAWSGGLHCYPINSEPDASDEDIEDEDEDGEELTSRPTTYPPAQPAAAQPPKIPVRPPLATKAALWPAPTADITSPASQRSTPREAAADCEDLEEAAGLDDLPDNSSEAQISEHVYRFVQQHRQYAKAYTIWAEKRRIAHKAAETEAKKKQAAQELRKKMAEAAQQRLSATESRQALSEMTGNRMYDPKAPKLGPKSTGKPPLNPAKARENISPARADKPDLQQAKVIDLCSPSTSASADVPAPQQLPKKRSMEYNSPGTKKKQSKSVKQARLPFSLDSRS